MCVITATAVTTALTAIGISQAAAASVASGVALAANIGMGVTAIGGITAGVTGAYQQGQAQKAEAEYQSQVAQNNAQIAEKNAAQERQAGLEVGEIVKVVSNILLKEETQRV